MPLRPIAWPSAITYSINQNVDFGIDDIREGFRIWESVADVTFRELAPGTSADMIVVRLDELKSAFGLTAGYAALSVVITESGTNGEQGRIAYVGLERQAIPSFDPVRVAAHEIGHGFGFQDEPSADSDQTLYSYVGSADRRLGSLDIEEIQQRLGPSPRNDLILHGDGSGRVLGGGGGDTIRGEGGDDLVYGNLGQDWLSGGTGADILFGGQGDDVVVGGSESDRLYGNLGNDSLYGGDGDDRLFGGRGDDLLDGNLGRDTFVGGRGGDLFIVSDGDTILDFHPEEGDRLVGWTPAITVLGVPPQEAALWVV